MSNFNISIPTPQDNEVVTVTKTKRKKEPYPGYTMFGNGKTTRFGGTSMDLLDICKQLGKPELSIMQFMRDEMAKNAVNKADNPNLITPAKSEEYTSYIKVAIKKNYAHMECLGIMKRVKRGVYLLNPRLYIPTKNVEDIQKMWDSLREANCGEQSPEIADIK